MDNSTCAVKECDRGRVKRGWCDMHYQRWKKNGDPERLVRAERAASRPSVCSIEDCDRPRLRRTWCRAHYLRWFRHGDPLGGLPSGVRPTRPRLQSAGYRAVHARLRKDLGAARAHQCRLCEARARDWAYDNADPGELIERVEPAGLRYSRNPAHYLPLCGSCHKRFDLDARRLGAGVGDHPSNEEPPGHP